MNRENIAISVTSAGKAYRLWQSPASRLTAPLLELAARILPGFLGLSERTRARASSHYRDFWALRDISFTVAKGESMAIIGRNGSGKSTLLQLIAGTLQTSTGSVQIHGRVAALLELGSGFNPEFTGRENVYLYGAVLGLSRGAIDARFESIANFADIGEFIDQAVKIYSSGMVVRLAFAVCAHVDADVLIIDEALGVGDARFQLKCARTIDRFIAEGRTLLFVSHDVSMVKRLCRRAVLLNHGELVYSGNPNDVVNLYSKLVAEGGALQDLQADLAALRAGISVGNAPALAPTTSGPVPPSTGKVQSDGTVDLELRLKALETVLTSHPDNATLSRRMKEMLENERALVQVSGKEFSYGGSLGLIKGVGTFDADGHARTWFTSGEPAVVRMVVTAHEELPEPIYALTIKNVAGVEIYGTNTLYAKQPAPVLHPGEEREISFAFNLNLIPGHYFISLGFTHYVGAELVVVHRRYDVIMLDIHGTDRAFGIANLHAQISAKDIASSPRH